MGKQIKKKNVTVDDDKDIYMEKKDYRKKKKSTYDRLNERNKKATHSYVKPTAIRAGNEIEYKMPQETIDDLLKNRKGEDRNKDAQVFLCDYVNEQYGLLGSCVRVIGM